MMERMDSKFTQYTQPSMLERIESQRSRQISVCNRIKQVGQLMSKSSPCLISGRGGHKRGTNKRAASRALKKQNLLNRIIRVNPDKKELFVRPYFLFENGINITPRAMVDAEFASREAKPHHEERPKMPLAGTKLLQSIESTTSARSMTSMASMVSASRFSMKQKSIASQSSHLSLTSTDFSKDDISFVVAVDGSDTDEDMLSQRAPSMFCLRADPPPKQPVLETHFTVKVGETHTMFLLQIPSQADSPESEVGKEITELNEAYDKSLEKSKALSHIAVQTTKIFRKHRKIYKGRNKRANSAAFASVWDMYDTYEALGMKEHEPDSILSLTSRAEGRVETIIVSDEQKEYEATFELCGQTFNRRFWNALMVFERLITNDQFHKNQLLYQGLLVQDPFSTEVKYNYTLTHLWTFSIEDVQKRCVTSMSWNRKNSNILAVGYGKFKFTTKCDGLVCIWNIKNPGIPERVYEFPDDPVTFVTFSNFRYHILAVTFYSGSVILVDIIARTLLVKANNHHYPLYYPVRQARWFPREHKTTILITCGKGGRIFRYKKSEFFLSNKIMTLGRPHGKIHGVDQPRKCYARRVLARRQPACEVLVQHPVDPQVYLVGSEEGCVYICSVQHRHDYKEIFYAHNGPVYNIQFNPFCSKVFLTCGADWCVRIWADTVYQPLITLESGMTAVQDALWSPLHSTVIVSTAGTLIELWDIRRRTSKPMSATESPSCGYNNVLMFSQNDFNVCVGDTEGNVHVMALSEMPFSPSYQESVLVDAIHSALITRPDVLDTLRKLGPPFVNKGHVDDYRTKLYRRLNRLHDDVL